MLQSYQDKKMMTEPTTQTPTQVAVALMDARRATMIINKNARDALDAHANHVFADGVRDIVDAGEMTVAEVATVIGMNRVRLYQILREYPVGSSS